MSRPVLTLPANTQGRDFVVGDIHGAFELLERAMADVQFDPLRDRLISVGDLVDRGPQSARCLEFLQKPWFFAVRGNHEEIFMEIFRENNQIDTARARQESRNDISWIFNQSADKLSKIRSAFENLPVAIEVETKDGTVGFVHADVPLNYDWQTFKQKLEEKNTAVTNYAIWSRTRISHKEDCGIKGVTRVFFGHTPQDDGVAQLGNCFYIDTGAVFRLLQPQDYPQNGLTLTDISAPDQDLRAAKPGSRAIVTITRPKGPAP